MTFRFSDDQLIRILNEASIYLCACPAQVCRQIQGLRALYAYQENCQIEPQANRQVHDLIAQAADEAHARLEQCLDDILTLEGWDRQSLKMPDGLRKLRDEAIAGFDRQSAF